MSGKLLHSVPKNTKSGKLKTRKGRASLKTRKGRASLKTRKGRTSFKTRKGLVQGKKYFGHTFFMKILMHVRNLPFQVFKLTKLKRWVNNISAIIVYD
jgi:hypothetical protein